MATAKRQPWERQRDREPKITQKATHGVNAVCPVTGRVSGVLIGARPGGHFFSRLAQFAVRRSTAPHTGTLRGT